MIKAFCLGCAVQFDSKNGGTASEHLFFLCCFVTGPNWNWSLFLFFIKNILCSPECGCFLLPLLLFWLFLIGFEGERHVCVCMVLMPESSLLTHCAKQINAANSHQLNLWTVTHSMDWTAFCCSLSVLCNKTRPHCSGLFFSLLLFILLSCLILCHIIKDLLARLALLVTVLCMEGFFFSFFFFIKYAFKMLP